MSILFHLMQTIKMAIEELKQFILIQEQMEMDKKLANMIFHKQLQMKEKSQVVAVLRKMEEFMEMVNNKTNVLILNQLVMIKIKLQ